MGEQNQAYKDAHNSDGRNNHVARSDLRLLLIIGGSAILCLFVVSLYWPNLSERTKFFTGNLLNLVIGIAVIAQVLIYRKQWQVMERQWQAVKEQTKAMRDSFYVAERAYLALEDIFFIEKGTYPRVVITLFNGGRTPAFKIYTEADVTVGTKPATGKLSTMGHPYGERAFMPAGTRKQVEAHFPNSPISMTHWNAINAGETTFFIRGAIHYDDFRGNTHILLFSEGYDVSLNRFRDYNTEDGENSNPN
jgi:hypothetical protein